MKLRPAKLSDYEEIVGMYKELVKATYHDMKIGVDAYFYGSVLEWFKGNKHITVCELDDGTIAGFTLAYVEDIGIIEPYYYGDIAYVKPEHRKTRVAHKLYHNVLGFGKGLGLKVQAKAYVGNGNKDKVDKIQSKFGSPQFTEYRTED